MKKLKLFTIFLAVYVCLLRGTGIPGNVYAQTVVDPSAWQQSAQGLNVNNDTQKRTAGLEMIVKADSTWPFLQLHGGVQGYYGKLAETGSIDLGTIQVPGQEGTVTSQEVDWAHNKLTFGSNTLSVWASRLAPALLAQTNSAQINLFSGDVRHIMYVNGTVTDVSKIVTSPSVPKYIAFPTSSGIQVQPLVSVDLSSLSSENWVLLWYGSNSHFVDTKKPTSFTNTAENIAASRSDNHTLPYSEAYQADAPMLVRFQNKPSTITQNTQEGGISITFPSGAGYLSVLPLMGREHLKSSETESWGTTHTIRPDVVSKINSWNQYLCYFPYTASENYGYTTATDTATITETISFIQLCNQGKKLAPLSPIVGIAKDIVPITITSSQGTPLTPVTLGTPSAYGPVEGIEDANTASLTTVYTWSMQGINKYINATQLLKSGSVPAELEQQLTDEFNKLFDPQGNPIHFDPWMFADHMPANTDIGYTYFVNPADTLSHVLSSVEALPQLHDQATTYVTTEKSQFSPDSVYNLQYGLGKQRGPYALEDVPGSGGTYYVRRQSLNPLGMQSRVPLYSYYSLSQYYAAINEQISSGDWDTAKSVLNTYGVEQDWATHYWFAGYEDAPSIGVVNANRYIAGLIGMNRMAEMTGDTVTADLTKALFAKSLVLRAAMAYYPQYYASAGLLEYPTNPNWQVVYGAGGWWGRLWKYNWTDASQDFRQVLYLNQFDIGLHDHPSRGGYWNLEGPSPYLIAFKDMVPGLGRFLGDYLKQESDVYIDVVEKNYPDWYRVFTQSGLAREHSLLHPGDSFQIFMAKSWIDNGAPDTLRKYLDIPWLAAGDLFYLSKLAETIKAYRGWCWSTDGTTCDDGSMITPTPTTPGDTDGDSDVDIFDYNAVITDFGKTGPQGFSVADFDDDGDVDIFDYNVVISNFGR